MIYFILDTVSQAIKVGFAVDVTKRLSVIQTATVNQLILLGSMPGSILEEKQLHQQFNHIRGEWFEITDALLSFIAERATTTPAFTKNFVKRDVVDGMTAQDRLGALCRHSGLPMNYVVATAIRRLWDEELGSPYALERKIKQLTQRLSEMRQA